MLKKFLSSPLFSAAAAPTPGEKSGLHFNPPPPRRPSIAGWNGVEEEKGGLAKCSWKGKEEKP